MSLPFPVPSARVRACIYSLPLFIAWIVPLTWENDERLVRSGRRSLALFLCYGVCIAATYVLSGILQLFIPNPGYLVDLFFFLACSLAGLGYVGLSGYLAYFEYRDRSLPGNLLDRIGHRFERLVSQ
jgi:hypothetical protein